MDADLARLLPATPSSAGTTDPPARWAWPQREERTGCRSSPPVRLVARSRRRAAVRVLADEVRLALPLRFEAVGEALVADARRGGGLLGGGA